MISKVDYDINEKIIHNKKLTEIYIGYEEFEWYYAKVRYSATCTKAIDFTLFDKTICGILLVEDHLSLEELGTILGFNVIDNPSDNPSERKYKDIAEYEILKDALNSLEEYGMIEGGDIYFSHCKLTEIGKEYLKKGKKFKVDENEEFDLYFDFISKDHSKAKENFEYMKGEEIKNINCDIDFNDESFLKSFCQSQIPDIYNTETLDSFKDAKCIKIQYLKTILYRVYILDIETGKIHTKIFDPTNKSINDFFAKYDVNYNKESFIKSNYSLYNNYNEKNEIVDYIKKYQEKINSVSEGFLEVLGDYYQNALYYEPAIFIKEISKIINTATKEIWLILQEISYKEEEIIKDLIDNNKDKIFFIYIQKNEVSEKLSDDITKNKNVYIILEDVIKEFSVVLKNDNKKCIVFKEKRSFIPIYIDDKLKQIEKVFIHRYITDSDLENEDLNKLRLFFANVYIPLEYKKINEFFSNIDAEKETSKELYGKIKNIDLRLLPFKVLGDLSNSYFEEIETKKRNLISSILENRKQKIECIIGSISEQIEKNKQPTNTFVDNLEKQLVLEKEECLEDEFDYFSDIEKKLRIIKNDIIIASKKKSIIIDTNILLKEPNIIDIIGHESIIVFSAKVLDELDKFKNDPKLKKPAQKAIQNIHKHMKDGNIKFEKSKLEKLPPDFDRRTPDNMILSVAIQFAKHNPILLTNDRGMSIKANTLEIPSKNIKELKELLGIKNINKK